MLLQNFNWRHLNIHVRVHCTWINGCPHTALCSAYWIEWAQHWWISLSLQHLSDPSLRGQSNMTLLSPPAPKTEMQEMTSMWLMFPWVMLVTFPSRKTRMPIKICERLKSWNQCCTCTTQWTEMIDIHACEALFSDLYEGLHWPKMVSIKSNCRAFKTLNIFWSMPLSLVCLCIKPESYSPVWTFWDLQCVHQYLLLWR